VKTQGTYKNMTVIAGGLNAGEKVIVNGQLRVAPKGKVVVQNTVSTTEPNAANQQSDAGGGL
jgi:multidrug efflux pump subunit AcrA (membrane-fusion protein)